MLGVVRNIGIPLSIVLTLAVSGCLVDESIVCPTVINPAIRIVIHVPDTSGDLEWDGKVVIREGDYIEVLAVYPPVGDGSSGEAVFTALGGYARPGVYSVSVRKTGYQNWAVPVVVAHRGDCGVVTQHLKATLIKKG